MATAFQADAFQNFATHGDAGFQVDDGGGGGTTRYSRLIIGNIDDGSDDWWQEYDA